MRKLKLFLSMLMLIAFSVGNVWAVEPEPITSGTFAKTTISEGWTSTGTGTNTTGCVVIGKDESITSPSVDLSVYESVSIAINARRYGSLSGSKATIVASFAGTELGSTDASSTSVAARTPIEFTVTSGMTTGTFVFTCSNATSAGSTHGAGIGSITITGVKPGSAVLETITITGDLSTKEYEEGAEIDFSGLTATGNYDDSSTEDLTSQVEWSFSPALTVGLTSVTVTATKDNISGNAVITGLTVTEHVIVPGAYDIPTNNALWGTSYSGSAGNITTLAGSKNDVSITINKNTGTSGMYVNDSQTRIYGGYTMTFSVPVGYAITALKFTPDGSNWAGEHTADVGTMTDNKNWSGEAKTVTISVAGTCRMKAVKVTYAVAASSKEEAGLAYAAADAQKLVKVGGSLVAPTLDNPNDLTVTYASSDANVVAVDENTGALTIKAVAGKAVITASSEEDATYEAGSASYTIFVAEQAGTAEDPLTEASAKALIDLGCTANAHVTGTIQGKTFYSNSGSYNVTLTNGFLFYYFYAAENNTPFESDILTNGDMLVGYGQLMKYGNNYEINPSYMVSRVPYSEPLVDISNTPETAYTPAQAISLYNDPSSDLTKVVYVKGVVTSANYVSGKTGDEAIYNGTYNVYVKAENDYSETPTTFEFYRMYKDELNNTFEDGDIHVGDLIIAKGILDKYNTTYEFAKGCQMYSLKPKVQMTFDDLELVVDDEVELVPKTYSSFITPYLVTYTIKDGSDDCVSLSDDPITKLTATAAGQATIRANVVTTDDFVGAFVDFTVTVSATADTRKVANSPAEFEEVSGDMTPNDITFTSYKGGAGTAPGIYNKGIRLYQAPSASAIGGYVTLTAKAGCTIDEVQITTTSTYSTTVAYSVDGNETLLKSESVAASGSYTTGTGLNVTSVNIVNKGTSSSGRLEIASIKVYYTGEPATIDHYELGGTYQTAFVQNEDFNHTGLIVYAAYDALGELKVDITSMCTFSDPDMSTTGEKTIEITYNEAVVASYTINVAADSRKVADSPATFTTVSGDMTPNDITFASYQGGAGTAPQNYNDGIRLYQAPSADAIGGFITLKAKKGCTIDQVKITTTNTYATTVAYSVDGNENLLGSESVAKSSDYSTPSGLNVESVNIVNKGTGSNGRLEIASIKVWYTGDALAVDHYILGGTYETVFEQYGTFSYEGLTVTAAYDAGETITEAVVGFTVEADLSTPGNKKANVMLNSVKIAEYDITVNASAKEDPALAYTPNTLTITKGDDWTAPVFSNEFGVSPISFVSDKPAIAAVDENGVITLEGGTGTAVITASFAGNDDYLASEATYTITVNEPAEDLSGTWVVATSVAAGDRIIIADVAAAGAVYTMGEQANNGTGNNRVAVESTVDEFGVLTPAAGTKTFLVVDAENGEFALQALNGNYLYAASNSSNHLKETNDITNVNTKWTITIDNGTATIKALHEGHNSRNWMRKNESSAIFSCYGSGQKDIVIYKKGTPTPVYTNVRTGLEPNHYYTICYPKAMTDVQGATLWSFVGKDANFAYIEQETATTIEAGKPYIMYATASTVQAVLGDETNAPGENGAIHGTFSDLVQDQLNDLATVAGSDLYLVIGDELRRATGSGTGSNTLPAQRAFVVVGEIPAAPAQMPAHVRSMPLQKDATQGFENLDASEKPLKVMIDGTLYILRGEKVYDATGRLVK